MPEHPPLIARAFVAAVGAVGLALLVVLGLQWPGEVDWVLIAILATAVVLGELFPIRLADGSGEVTSSTTFTFALLLIAGPAPAAIAQASACLAADIRDRKTPLKAAFNVGQYMIALAVASLIFTTTTDVGRPIDVGVEDVPGLLLSAIAFFVINTAIVSTVIALHQRSPLRRQLASSLVFHCGSEAILLGLAPLAVVALEYAPVIAPLMALPLVAVHRAGRHAAAHERTAAHDGLTGLPNRAVLQDRTELALDRAARDGDFVAVMLLDLDRFKEINDTLGHAAGDAVLIELGQRLAATVGPTDTVARLGGDEFAVLVRSAPGPHEAATLAERLRTAVLPPVHVEGVRLSLDVSVGLAWHGEHGTDVETLLQRADVAMYQAKGAGGGVRVYSAESDVNSLARLAMAQDLRDAVERGEVRVHFQPQIDLQTGRVAAVEALARWTHPKLGPVPPAEFIPVAEETGLITALTDLVLDEAVGCAGGWRRQGLDLSVAVNLSARTLADEHLPVRVAGVCAAHAFPPESLVLEVTESMVLNDPVAAAATLQRIAALGVVISIDDFGTGFSSLEHLKRLPVGEVKIDRSFINGLDGDERDRAIVRGTLGLAHALGMRVVGEGVEHEGMAGDLAGMGCELGQGFHWSRAVPADEVPATIARLAALRAIAA